MFSAARAVSSGLSVHGDVFYQYGPITAWLHGGMLRVFGGHLLVLRLVSVAAILVALVLSFHAARKIYSEQVAFIGSTLWIGLASFFSQDFPPLAWSSDVALSLQALILFLLARRGQHTSLHNPKPVFLAGVLLVVLLLTRLSTGALSLMALIVIILLCPQRWKLIRPFFAGVTSMLAIVALLLTISGSIVEWWRQTIQIPRHIYLSSLGEFGASSVGSLILTKGLPLLALFVCAANVITVVARVEDRWKRGGLEILGFLCIGGVLWITSEAGNGSLIGREPLLWSILLSVPLLVVHQDLSAFIDSREGAEIVFVGLSIASLIQVFPIADPRHLWWSIFPGIFPATNLFLKHFRSGLGRVVVGLVVGSTVVSATSGLIEALRVPRYELSSSVFDGMLARRDLTLAIQDELVVMKEMEQIHGPRPSLNLCVDGLYAGLSGEIGFPDPYFVDGWDFPSEVHDQNERTEFVRREQPFIWLCPPVVQPSVEEDAPTTSEILDPFGYRLVERRKCLKDDPYFNEWPRLVYLAVPTDWRSLPLEASIALTSKCEVKDGN